MAKKKLEVGICPICGKTAELDTDHIPPKCLFPKPRPELTTIKACVKCNRGSSKDDEHLRNVISMRQEVGTNEYAMKNNAAMFRSFEYPEAKGLKRAFLKSVFEVEMSSPAGLYLGKRLAFTVERKRIHRSMEKLTRGLFYHHTNRILPREFTVWVLADEDVAGFDAESRSKIHSQFLLPLTSQPAIVIGEKQFHYRFAIAADGENYSTWAYSFFESVPFLCMTVPKDSLD